MEFATPLVPGRLRRRWMRFLSEVELDTGEVVRAHCPNPGAMLGLKEPGLRVWLEPNNDPKKKLRYGWRLAELPGGHWAGIDTGLPNRVVREALLARRIPELAQYGALRAEVKFGAKSRVDFVLSEPGLPNAFVEVKNVHLRRTGDWAEFPDSVTERGLRHLEELCRVVEGGQRAVMFYLVQRTDCARLAFAADLDPSYADAIGRAAREGVELIAYDARISPEGITIRRPIPVTPGPVPA